jgi:hypothetical protein
MATTNKRFVAKNGLDNNNQTITNLGASGNSLGLSGTGDLTIAISGTATLTLPAGNDTLVTLTGSQVLTNKTLTSPIISSISNTGTLTLPTSTDTLVGRATSDTLTNKTISGSNNTLSNIGNSSLTNSSVSFNGVSVALGASGTLYTDDISEDGTPVNLWFTNSRARTAISVTDSGGDGSLSYDNGTGIITYTGPSATEVRAHLSAGTGLTYTSGQFAIDSTVATLTGTQVLTNKTISGADNTLSNIGNSSLTNSSITINGTATSLGGTRTLVTDDIAEDGSPINLWYTDTRSRAAISVTDSGGDGSLSYNSGTGVITYTGPSAAEVRAHFSAGTGVSITSGQISIGQAVATTDNVTFAGVTADNVRIGVTAAGEIDTSAGNLTIDSTGGTTVMDDDVNVTGNMVIDGNLTVSGTTVTINATNLAVEDNMIYLNSGSTVTHPDLGFAGNYNDGTYRHAGLFRDESDGRWKFFHQYTPEPDASAYIDITHASFALAPVQASSFIGSVTGNVTGNASTATAWQTARTLTLSGDVTGTSAAFDGSGNISITTTIAADSVALGTDTTGNYVASITNGSYITGGNGGSEGAALTLAVDATSANTASKVVARDASGNFSAGTITATLSGNASTVTNGVYTTDTGTVTNAMLAGSIANNKLANSTISGKALGTNLDTLTLAVSGTGLSGSQTYNGSSAVTFTVTSNATSANTASTIVARDSSGNFTAGTITAALSGNATTTSQRAFTSDISTTGQGRFTGWYSGNAATGFATEAGISGGQGYLIAYNRDTTSYGILNINGSTINIAPQGGSLTGPSGNIILHAGNYNSYSPTLTGTGASGTWSINVTGTAGSAPANGGTSTEVNGSRFSTTASSYVNFYTWAHFHGGTAYGLYFPSSGSMTHMYPSATTYGSFMVDGSRNGYWGAMFSTGVGNAGWMTTGNTTGFYNHTYGWKYYHESGVFYIYSGTYGGGTAYTALHSGNYGSYALPLSGGTLTGVVRLNSTAYFTADSATGYRFNSSNDAYNNMIIYDSGNVYIRGSLGVGTSSPSQALHITGYARMLGLVVDETGGTRSAFIGYEKNWTGSGSSNNLAIASETSNSLKFYTNGSATLRMELTTAGTLNVGGSVDSGAVSSYLSGYNAFGARVTNNAYFNFTGLNASGTRTFYVLGTGGAYFGDTVDFYGGVRRTNVRVSSDQNYPLGHYTPGETVFEIDPTWSQSELQEYFGSSSVSWVSDSTAPGGYAIQLSGPVYVGGVYNSGFPYIPVDQDDVFMMECWIKDVAGTNGHYMGSIDYNASFSSLGGNPGSYGYWVMLGSYPGTSWTRYVGYIGGFGSSTGQFVSGTKYWTPQALFNYGGQNTSYISGWKAIKVSHRGNHRFLNNVGIGGSHAPDVALSVNGYVHIGNGGNYLYMGGTVGNANSWGSRHYTSGGNHTINASAFQFDNVGYGSTWTVTFNSSGITASGNITAYSDVRLKENIMNIENALDKVQHIRGITYTRNDTGDTTKRHAGVIAQEVEQVLPEVVEENSSGIKHVAYGNMVGLLIEAIKELKKENEVLTTRINKLENN